MIYKLNMIPNRVLPVVNISQYDESRDVTFALYENETEYTPTTATINIGDQTYNGTISGNKVTITLGSEISQESGYINGELKDGNVASCNFRLRIDSTPIK